MESVRKIALVLGSGGFRGPAHAGVLAKLHDLGVPIDAIVGCCVGGVVGAYYAAAGLRSAELLDHGFGVRKLGVLSHGLAMRDVPFRSTFLRWAAPVREKLSILDGLGFDALHHGVREIGFLMLDLERRERIFVSTGHHRGFTLSEAVRASARLPVVFPPMIKEVDGLARRLVDGAFASPTPIGQAVAFPIRATHVIAVNLSGSRSRGRYSEVDRWGRILGDRLLFVRPDPRRWGWRGGKRYVSSWYQAGYDSFGTEEAARIARWLREMPEHEPSPLPREAAEEVSRT